MKAEIDRFGTYSFWHRIELSIKTISTASEGPATNMRLLLVWPGLRASLFVHYIPIMVLLVFARLNGSDTPLYEAEDAAGLGQQVLISLADTQQVSFLLFYSRHDGLEQNLAFPCPKQ